MGALSDTGPQSTLSSPPPPEPQSPRRRVGHSICHHGAVGGWGADWKREEGARAEGQASQGRCLCPGCWAASDVSMSGVDIHTALQTTGA